MHFAVAIYSLGNIWNLDCLFSFSFECTQELLIGNTPCLNSVIHATSTSQKQIALGVLLVSYENIDFFFLIGIVFLFKTNLLTLDIGPFLHYMFFSDGFQCAPPGFDWLPASNKGITYQNGQYCQKYNLNHKKCGGESKFSSFTQFN